MPIHAISESLSNAAATLQKTLNKNTVIVLSLEDDGKMSMGWAGEKTVHILGLMSWGTLSIAENIINEDVE